ncbi:MAG: hypothetical protein M0Q51_00645 [Bacteroidales bacterium]|nr:hypothetical protein [Bacteroidales bacterium]
MKNSPVILSFCMLFMLVMINNVFSQDEELEGYDSIADRVLLKKELTGGVTIHILGMGANFRKGINKTFFNSRIFEIEFVSMKHPKQIRVINPYYYDAKSYVYGKLNHVYILRAGYGFKKLLNRKPYWGGVELRVLYMGGLSVAFAKPVYLYFWDETYTYVKEEKYNPDNYYHNSEYIYGRAPFTDGLGELKVYPGVYAKAGLNFEFGALNSKIRALEAGGVVEYFPIAIPIMAFNPAQNFLVTFYLNFSFGKRYN